MLVKLLIGIGAAIILGGSFILYTNFTPANLGVQAPKVISADNEQIIFSESINSNVNLTEMITVDDQTCLSSETPDPRIKDLIWVPTDNRIVKLPWSSLVRNWSDADFDSTGNPIVNWALITIHYDLTKGKNTDEYLLGNKDCYDGSIMKTECWREPTKYNDYFRSDFYYALPCLVSKPGVIGGPGGPNNADDAYGGAVSTGCGLNCSTNSSTTKNNIHWVYYGGRNDSALIKTTKSLGWPQDSVVYHGQCYTEIIDYAEGADLSSFFWGAISYFDAKEVKPIDLKLDEEFCFPGRTDGRSNIR